MVWGVKNLNMNVQDVPKKKPKFGKKKIITAAVLSIAVVSLLLWKVVLSGDAKIQIDKTQLVRGQTAEVDVKVSGLAGEYPAASFEIQFDKDKLEFLKINQGNMKITNQKNGESFLPEWSYNTKKANDTGNLSTMYLDTTAGDMPIIQQRKNRTLFRLAFRVKESCDVGDKLKLNIHQATFAVADASKEHTVAMYNKNLIVQNRTFKVRKS